MHFAKRGLSMNNKPIDDRTLDEIRDLAQNDLYVFAKGILGFDWLVPHIHMPICRLLELYNGWDSSLRYPREHYEQILRSKHVGATEEVIVESLENGLKKLLIVLPRGWLKTTLVSISFPLWRGIRSGGNVRCLLAQNTFTNAVAKNRTIKETVEGNVLFRRLWPELLPGPQSVWKAECLALTRPKSWPEGTFDAAGTRTQVTSRHYDLIIEDDTVSPDKDDLGEENVAPRKEDVVQAIGWHRLVPPLLTDLKTAQNIVVGTRWFEKDLISWNLEHEAGEFVSYIRSCREDAAGAADETSPATYPERFDDRVLSGLKTSLGPYLFSCLYLNKPLRSQDMVFQPEWFRYYDTPPTQLVCYTTVDPGGDPEHTKGETDYNVVLTCGKCIQTGRVYVLEYSREQCSPSRLISLIFEHVRRYRPVKVGLESVAYQHTLRHWIRERMRSVGEYFLVESLSHTSRSKGHRILGLQPFLSNEMLWMKLHHKELIGEMLAFPLGANDDLVDALASQLELWQATALAVKPSVPDFQDDPMSVSAAIKHLREKAVSRQPWEIVSPSRLGGNVLDALSFHGTN